LDKTLKPYHIIADGLLGFFRELVVGELFLGAG
jgi:hypothetical protein